MKAAEVTLEEALRQARVNRGEGNLIVAERIYRDILDADSRQPDALREIGIVSYLRGKAREAHGWFSRALTVEPDNPIVLSNFAIMAAETGRIEEAVESWRRAIELSPDYVDAYSNLARVLVQTGDAKEAIRLCRAGLDHAPDHVDIQVNLGFALQADGAGDEAVHVWENIVAMAPDHPVVCANLANAYRDLGRTRDAVAMGERAVEADPYNASAHLNLGNAYLEQGDVGAAERCYLRAMECDPRNADAYDNMGAALLQQGRLDEAPRWHRFALAIDDTRAKSHAWLSMALRAVGAFAEAEAAAQQALLLEPQSVAYQVTLADLLLAVDRPDEAEAVLNDALSADPDSMSTRLKLARALERLDRFDEAEAMAVEARDRIPESPWPPLTLAQIRLMGGDTAGAGEAGEAALALAPDSVPALVWFAEYYVTVGDLEAADRCARRALELQPNAIGAYGPLANTRRFEDGDSDLEAMENAYAVAGNRQTAALGFALGKALDDAGRHGEAFECFTEANALRWRGFHYSRRGAEHRLATIRDAWPAERIAALAEHGDPAPEPVFIVGMPRSGTTLLEQILSAHPDVFGAGELGIFGRVLRRHGAPGPATAAPIGRDYVDAIRRLAAPSASRITDKMPGNYQNLGAIAAALPNATIIHARRDPVDTCLSCFQQSFARGQHWSYDLEELGHQYRVYEGIMNHWRAVMPDRFLDIDYEDVVADLETQARRLVAAAGLAWDPCCLDFHASDRAVLTASKGQVRRPIYRSSINKATRYGERIEPLRSALQRHAGLAQTGSA